MTPAEEPWWVHLALWAIYAPVIAFTRVERACRRWVG